MDKGTIRGLSILAVAAVIGWIAENAGMSRVESTIAIVVTLAGLQMAITPSSDR